MLQPQLTPQPKTPLNLLIVTDVNLDVTIIVKSLESLKTPLNYKVITVIEAAYLSSLEGKIYDAVLLYLTQQDSKSRGKLLKIRQWLQKPGQDEIPLILITEVLADRDALKYTQQGVTDCVLTDNLFSLPEILQRYILSYQSPNKQQSQVIQARESKASKELVYEISKQLNSSLNPEQILQNIVTQVGKSFQVERVILCCLNEGKNQVEREWRVTEKIPSLLNESIPIEEARELIIFPKSKSKNQVTNIANKQTSQELDNCQFYSVCSVSIVIKEKNYGRLKLQTTNKERKLTQEEIDTIKIIAEQIAIAINLKKQQDCLQDTIHELRNPLTAILLSSRMLSDEIYGSLNSKQMQYVNSISACGTDLLELINDLLDLSKIEADKQEIYKETVPVHEVCLASISTVQESAKQKGLELNLEIDNQVSFCQADPQRLKQILRNLLSNAVKFTVVGSVTLKVQKNSKSIDFSAIDTGIGISETDLDKVFEPFIQIKNRVSNKHKGSGLGLPLSRKLARLHGGDITVTSQKDKGSCFTLHLPL